MYMANTTIRNGSSESLCDDDMLFMVCGPNRIIYAVDRATNRMKPCAYGKLDTGGDGVLSNPHIQVASYAGRDCLVKEDEMEYRFLGRSGLRVSEVCLGTMAFGVSVDEAAAKAIVDAAFDCGVNFMDTANSYSGGVSEDMLGKALVGRRDGVVIATKFTNPVGKGPNDSGMSRKHIMQTIEESLRRLQTDYVDIYYLHHVETRTPLDEALRAMDDLVRQGKVRCLAVSNYEAWRLSETIWTCDTEGFSPIVCYQPQYSLVVRDIEAELVPLCRFKNVGIVPWGPLASGFLTGKYKPGQRSVEGSRSAEGWLFHDRFFSAKADEALAELLKVSKEVGKTPAQVALRWALQKPGITSVIAGARRPDQFRDSCGTSGWSLDKALMDRLDAASAVPLRYPYSMESTTDARRDTAIDMPSL